MKICLFPLLFCGTLFNKFRNKCNRGGGNQSQTRSFHSAKTLPRTNSPFKWKHPDLLQNLMDSSLANSPSFHHVLLNSMQRFVCNPDRQTHTSRGILAAGHRLLRIDFILLFQLPSKSQSDNRSSACSATQPSLFQYHVSWLQKIYFGIIRVWLYKYYYDCKQLSSFKRNQLLQVHEFPDCWKPGLSHWDGLDQTRWQGRSFAEAGGHGRRRRQWGEVKMSHSLAWNYSNEGGCWSDSALHECYFPIKVFKRGRRPWT